MIKEYFIAVVSIAFFGGIVVMISPKGYEKHLRLLCGFCSVALILFPLFSFFEESEASFENIVSLFSESGKQDNDYDEIYNGALLDSEMKNAEERLKSEIKQELSVNNDAFDVNLVLEEKSDVFYISSVEVIIYPEGAMMDPRAIEKHVNESVGCECVIIYDF